MPGHHAAVGLVDFEVLRADLVSQLGDKRQVFFIAGGQEGQCADFVGDAGSDVLGEVSGTQLDDVGGLFAAAVWPLRAVAAHDPQRDRDGKLLALAPQQQWQLSARSLGFGDSDGIAKRHTGIARELGTADAEDHVIDLNQAGGG